MRRLKGSWEDAATSGVYDRFGGTMARRVYPIIPFFACILTLFTRDAEKLGKVHFDVSCLPATAPQFDRAVSMLHSFWYPEGYNAFAEITKSDPGCAMAYWGMAISRRGNPL